MKCVTAGNTQLSPSTERKKMTTFQVANLSSEIKVRSPMCFKLWRRGAGMSESKRDKLIEGLMEPLER